MFAVVYDCQAELIAWAEARIPDNRFRNDAKAIGVTRNGDICGVAVFDNFSVGSCCVSVASDGSRRWMTREFLIRVFAYPFLQLGYRRLTCFIAASNHDSIRLCEHLGWSREGVLRRGAPDGDDMLLLGLLREECRYLPERMTGKVHGASL
jgi:RimJ/RimL family protein N-acetyltransferase